MTDIAATIDDVRHEDSVSTMLPNEGSGETELPQRVCEPLGVAEVAAFLDVQDRTVHQWTFRGYMPPHDWVTNGLPCWNKPTIIGWAIASGRLTPDDLPAREAAWAEIRDRDGTRSPRGMGAPSRQQATTSPATAKPEKASGKARKSRRKPDQ